MKKKVDEDGLRSLLKAACQEAGSPKNWAQSVNVSAQYVSDVMHNRRKPGKAIYEALGYQKHVEYVRKDIWEEKNCLTSKGNTNGEDQS